MAPNSPHLLVFMHLYNLLPLSVGRTWALNLTECGKGDGMPHHIEGLGAGLHHIEV